ncbi:MAG: histidinol dehydrogenase [Bacteroidetes bacterium]|nr:histidinol dehydrogenase [Bacteroidota bacterium]
MKTYLHPDKTEWEEILQRPVFQSGQLSETVSKILQEIKSEGDVAVSKYTQKFDKVSISKFQVLPREIEDAEKQLSPALKKAIQAAKRNIEHFHRIQLPKTEHIETMPGVKCWRKPVPIQKVGLYIPGGTAPLFSSVLMLAVPAKLAGCSEIVLCTPPQKDGSIHPAILYSARLTGVTSIFKMGGVQAIGAMAFGTETVTKVHKIFGPGNQYVTEAKQQISREGIAIDLPAGPSEVLVYADTSSKSAYVAADLLSQAEHGTDSQVVLITNSQAIVDEVLLEIQRQLPSLPRKEIAEAALLNSVAIVVESREAALEIINKYAPEHLILSITDVEAFADEIINAGSVFIGNYSPESVGDYASGTNHTLPTNGFAKSYSGASVDSFLKKITFQQLSREGLKNLGGIVEEMAEAEMLFAHKNAVSVRLKDIA